MFQRFMSMVSLVVSLLAVSAFTEVLKIVTFPIPVMVESEEKGVFIELVKSAAKKAGLEVAITVLPPPRAIAAFTAKEYDMLFPALDVQFHGQPMPLASKELIYVKEDFAFTKKGKPELASIAELVGKKVGITSAYPYSEELLFNKNITLEPAVSDEINIRKLVNDRIDVFVVEGKSGWGAVVKEKATESVVYPKDKPISKQNVYFAFQKGEQGSKLEKGFSAALKALKTDGTFGNIMKKADQ